MQGHETDRTGPLVSIVITSCNYEQYVGIAIASALAQTYPRIEIVVVDDGSVDGSREIIAAFGGCIKAIFQDNFGQTAAVNAGFAATHGELVLFLDADDLLAPDAIERVLDACRPNSTCVQFRLQIVDKAGAPSGGVMPNIPAGRTPEQIRAQAFTTGLYAISPTSGCVYQRAFLEKVLPLSSSEFFHAPDAPLNAVAPLYGDVVTIDEVLGSYRVHGRNFWAQQKLEPQKFPFYVDADHRRVAFFRQHAEALGIALPQDLLDRSLQHLQFRLTSLKLQPQEHPVLGDKKRRLLHCALIAALAERDRRSVNAVIVCWMVLVAIAPRIMAERLVALRFVRGSRPPLLNRILRNSGLLPA